MKIKIVLILFFVLSACSTSTSPSYSQSVPNDSDSTISSATGIIKKCGTANAPFVNVYATPEFSVDVIGKIDYGVAVTATGRSSDSKFVLISLSGHKGWISDCDIVSEQNLGLLPVVSYTGSKWGSYALSESSSGSSSNSGNLISSTQASSYVGQVVTVRLNHAYCSYQASSNGSPTFCNDKPYPTHDFTLLVWGQDWEFFDGACLLVTGKITLYEGKAQIEAVTKSQVEYCD